MANERNQGGAAVAEKPTQQREWSPPAKPYDELIEWLSEQDAIEHYIGDGPTRKDANYPNVPASIVPAHLCEKKVLAAAWTHGLIEFGRCNHSFGYQVDAKGEGLKALDENGNPIMFAWLDSGVSWLNQKMEQRISGRAFLNEPPPVTTVIRQTKVRNEVKKEYEIKKTPPMPGSLLRIQIRLTDKGKWHLSK